jgi:hypothetical protein
MSVCFTFKERMGVAKNLGLEGTQPQKHTHTHTHSPTPLLRCCKQVNLFRGDKTIARSPAVLITVLFEREAMEFQALDDETTDFIFAVDRSKL